MGKKLKRTMESKNEQNREVVSPSIDPAYLQYLKMQQNYQQEDEIDLLELWNALWARKWFIISISLIFGVVAAAYSLTLHNYYKAEAILVSTAKEGGKGGGLAAALGGLGGLASMVGVSVGGGGSTEEYLAVLKSRQFIWSFVKDKNLMPVLFEDEWDQVAKVWRKQEKQPTLWDAYRLFNKGILKVSKDKESGLITLTVEWIDANKAAEWVKELTERLNKFLREQAIEKSNSNLRYLKEELLNNQVADMQQTLFELISNEQKTAMLANTQKEFAFRVIDKAVAPDKKSKPRRAIIAILATVIGGFFAILWVLFASRKAKDSSSLLSKA